MKPSEIQTIVNRWIAFQLGKDPLSIDSPEANRIEYFADRLATEPERDPVEPYSETDYMIEIVRLTGAHLSVLITNNAIRTRPYPLARFLHMYVRHRVFGMTTTDAARYYQRSHCVMIHGTKVINDLLATDGKFRSESARLFKMIDDGVEYNRQLRKSLYGTQQIGTE